MWHRSVGMRDLIRADIYLRLFMCRHNESGSRNNSLDSLNPGLCVIVNTVVSDN